VAWEFGVDFNVVAVLCTRHVSGVCLWVLFVVLGFSSWYLGFVCAFMSLTVGCVSACAPDVSSLLVW